MPRAFFAAFGLVPLGTGCCSESPTPHSPHHQLSKVGQAETVNNKKTEDIGGGGDLITAKFAQQVWMHRGHCAEAHTCLLLSFPKALSTEFVSHHDSCIWRHAQPDVRLFINKLYLPH